MDLATLSFLERNESILFISRMNGVGKSHIARSLGYIACQKEYKTYYTTCSELINDLNAGVYEKTLGKRMRKYISCDLWSQLPNVPERTPTREIRTQGSGIAAT